MLTEGVCAEILVGKEHLRTLVRPEHRAPKRADAANYTFDHLDLGGKYRANISFASYDAGHMVYLPTEGLRKMKSDQVNFMEMAGAK
jgi:carboxypeptidase C (cathepsin A)